MKVADQRADALANVADSGRLRGPGEADLAPLVEASRTAAAGCNYAAALKSAEHIADFEPRNPWLLANRSRLSALAERQKRTEQIVWQASAALSREELKVARDHAEAAADVAVSCQSRVLAQLLTGIDTAIAQRHQLREAKRRRLAAALLPHLVSAANAISAGDSATAANLLIDQAVAAGTDITNQAGVTDACAFRYDYNDRARITPRCVCSGYVFDTASARCVNRLR